MSQYGARGRALAGQDAATILAHYYQGAVLSPIDPATSIRVLVLSKWAASEPKPLVLYGRRRRLVDRRDRRRPSQPTRGCA